MKAAMSSPRVALVTGASSGLGAAIARALAARGWHVLAASRRATVPQLGTGAPGRIEPLALDVARPESIDGVAQALFTRGLNVELLVNAAGANIAGYFEEVSREQGRALMDTNFHGVADTIRAFAPPMRQRRRGTILTVGSLAGLVAPPGEAYYAASKHALEGLHESLQYEFGRFGVRICLAEPGFMRTALARSSPVAAFEIADYADLGAALRQRWVNSIDAGADPDAMAAPIVEWGLTGRGLRRRFGADTRWPVLLKRLLPESAFFAGARRRYGL